MKKIIAIAAIPLVLCACHPKSMQSLEKDTEITKQSDSTHIETKVTARDSSLKVEADSSKIQAVVAPDKDGNINLQETIVENERTKASVSIKDGKLNADCICKALEVKLKIYEKEIREYKSHKCAEAKERVKEVTVTKMVRYVPWWAKLLAAFGIIATILLVIIVKLK